MTLLFVVLPLIVFGAAFWLINHYIWLPDDAMNRDAEMEKDGVVSLELGADFGRNPGSEFWQDQTQAVAPVTVIRTSL